MLKKDTFTMRSVQAIPASSLESDGEPYKLQFPKLCIRRDKFSFAESLWLSEIVCFLKVVVGVTDHLQNSIHGRK